MTTDGFAGPVSVAQLWQSGWETVPNRPGVYLVKRLSSEAPEFLEVGSGGHFKGQHPDVPVVALLDKWVVGSDIVYIGKASRSLKRRVGDYVRFGQGKPVGNWGGRYIWQLAYAADLVIAWYETPDTETVENCLLQAFMGEHGGRLPFANIQRPGPCIGLG